MQNFKRVTIITAILLLGMAIWLPALRSRRVAAQSNAATLAGAYGFAITVPYAGNSNSSGVLQGTVTFDGAGNASAGSITASSVLFGTARQIGRAHV